MTNIAFEDSRLRHLLHAVTNCIQALYGYCELGEYKKAVAIAHECAGDLATIRAELEAMQSDDNG